MALPAEVVAAVLDAPVVGEEGVLSVLSVPLGSRRLPLAGCTDSSPGWSGAVPLRGAVRVGMLEYVGAQVSLDTP